MRPGQETPDNHCQRQRRQRRLQASMRPGQETPDKSVAAEQVGADLGASMRPGQETPDKSAEVTWGDTGRAGFNEAGARNPG